ncbi:MAG: YiiD C-terminal domain-containing protein [Gammaproteobacteria bacterium]
MNLIKEYEAFLQQNVPMIAYSELSIAKIDQEQCIVKMPFIDKNKNHVQSMYLGSLTIGAEVSAGILTFNMIKMMGINSTVVFKESKATFLRLAHQDVYFICSEVQKIKESLQQAQETKQRVNFNLPVIAVEDLNKLDEQVAVFEFTTSVKLLTE